MSKRDIRVRECSKTGFRGPKLNVIHLLKIIELCTSNGQIDVFKFYKNQKWGVGNSSIRFKKRRRGLEFWNELRRAAQWHRTKGKRDFKEAVGWSVVLKVLSVCRKAVVEK